MADPFDPQRSRAKRPMPMWWDAFLRDTQHLEADEVGAYLLMLGAMWTAKDCCLPHDDRKLARVCRVSVVLFKRRIGPAILPLMAVEDGKVISWRLRKEACFTESSVVQQRCRRTKENPANLLKGLGWGLTTDISAEKPPEQPTQPPNNLHKKSPTDSKRARKPKLEPQRFAEFWDEVYPHRGGAKKNRAKALQKYTAAINSGVPESQIIDVATAFQRDRKVIDGYAPDPATWLHNSGWEDEIETGPQAPKAPDTPEARREQLRYLEAIADQMEKSGSNWVIGSRYVDDKDLRRIYEMGLAPEKIGQPND